MFRLVELLDEYLIDCGTCGHPLVLREYVAGNGDHYEESTCDHCGTLFLQQLDVEPPEGIPLDEGGD